MSDKDDDDLSKQLLDIFLKNETLNNKVKPILLGCAIFNFLIVTLLFYIIYKIHTKP